MLANEAELPAQRRSHRSRRRLQKIPDSSQRSNQSKRTKATKLPDAPKSLKHNEIPKTAEKEAQKSTKEGSARRSRLYDLVDEHKSESGPPRSSSSKRQKRADKKNKSGSSKRAKVDEKKNVATSPRTARRISENSAEKEKEEKQESHRRERNSSRKKKREDHSRSTSKRCPKPGVLMETIKPAQLDGSREKSSERTSSRRSNSNLDKKGTKSDGSSRNPTGHQERHKAERRHSQRERRQEKKSSEREKTSTRERNSERSKHGEGSKKKQKESDSKKSIARSEKPKSRLLTKMGESEASSKDKKTSEREKKSSREKRSQRDKNSTRERPQKKENSRLSAAGSGKEIGKVSKEDVKDDEDISKVSVMANAKDPSVMKSLCDAPTIKKTVAEEKTIATLSVEYANEGAPPVPPIAPPQTPATTPSTAKAVSKISQIGPTGMMPHKSAATAPGTGKLRMVSDVFPAAVMAREQPTNCDDDTIRKVPSLKWDTSARAKNEDFVTIISEPKDEDRKSEDEEKDHLLPAVPQQRDHKPRRATASSESRRKKKKVDIEKRDGDGGKRGETPNTGQQERRTKARCKRTASKFEKGPTAPPPPPQPKESKNKGRRKDSPEKKNTVKKKKGTPEEIPSNGEPRKKGKEPEKISDHKESDGHGREADHDSSPPQLNRKRRKKSIQKKGGGAANSSDEAKTKVREKALPIAPSPRHRTHKPPAKEGKKGKEKN